MLLSFLFVFFAPFQGAQEFDRLADQLEDSNGPVRRRAVTGLAKLGSEEAFELVIEALADPEAEVADTAQLALAKTPTDCRPSLFGRGGLRSRDGLVRERVAEALGRLDPAPPAERWRAALADREAGVRAMGLWSLERSVRAGRLPAADTDKSWQKLRAEVLRLAVRGRSTQVRARALLALAAWDPQSAFEHLMEGLDSKHAVIRCAAVRSLGELPRDSAEEDSLARALWDSAVATGFQETSGARRLRIQALGSRGSRAAAGALVGALEQARREESKSKRGPAQIVDSLVPDVVAGLQALSGLKHARDPRPWRDWFESLPVGWTARPEGPGGRVTRRADEQIPRALAAPGEDTTVARLAGLPIPTGGVAFLIDMSGSMWNRDSDGQTMKELVDVELARCLAEVPEQTHFNLYPYATEPTAWEKELVPANRRNRRRAVEDFIDCRLRGRGNLWDAVQLALSDEEVESILIFTDGAPTGGPRWDVDLMVDLLLEQGRLRPIEYHAVVTEDKNGRLVRAWQRLARESGGQAVVVDRHDLGPEVN